MNKYKKIFKSLNKLFKRKKILFIKCLYKIKKLPLEKRCCLCKKNISN